VEERRQSVIIQHQALYLQLVVVETDLIPINGIQLPG